MWYTYTDTYIHICICDIFNIHYIYNIYIYIYIIFYEHIYYIYTYIKYILYIIYTHMHIFTYSLPTVVLLLVFNEIGCCCITSNNFFFYMFHLRKNLKYLSLLHLFSNKICSCGGTYNSH